MQLSQNDFTVKLQYIRDHSCGSVDKPCERNGTFPTHDVSSEGEDGSGPSDSDSTSAEEASGMVEGGKISQRYFFAEIAPPHIHESSSEGHQESDSWA